MADNTEETGPKGIDAAAKQHSRAPVPAAPKPPESKPEDDADLYEDSPDGSDPKDAELNKLRAALKKANKDAERNRRRAAREEDDEGEAEGDPAEDLRVELYTRDAVELLREQGVTGDRRRLRRVVRMLDSVDPDEVADAIEQLREDDPDLFKKKDDDEDEKPKRRRRPATGPGGAERGTSEKKGNLSSTSQKMLGMMRGGW